MDLKLGKLLGHVQPECGHGRPRGAAAAAGVEGIILVRSVGAVSGGVLSHVFPFLFMAVLDVEGDLVLLLRILPRHRKRGSCASRPQGRSMVVCEVGLHLAPLTGPKYPPIMPAHSHPLGAPTSRCGNTPAVAGVQDALPWARKPEEVLPEVDFIADESRPGAISAIVDGRLCFTLPSGPATPCRPSCSCRRRSSLLPKAAGSVDEDGVLLYISNSDFSAAASQRSSFGRFVLRLFVFDTRVCRAADEDELLCRIRL